MIAWIVIAAIAAGVRPNPDAQAHVHPHGPDVHAVTHVVTTTPATSATLLNVNDLLPLLAAVVPAHPAPAAQRYAAVSDVSRTSATTTPPLTPPPEIAAL